MFMKDVLGADLQNFLKVITAGAGLTANRDGKVCSRKSRFNSGAGSWSIIKLIN